MRKRSISIPIRVTEKELTTIETKATKAGMNRTDYLIACAVGKRITVIDDLTPLLAELRRIGNNLNQLTRLAHLGKIEAISLAETNEVLQQTYANMTHAEREKRRLAEAKCWGSSGRQSTGRRTKSRYAIRLSKTNSKAVASKDTTL